jgi:hypothetical protein
MRILSWKQVHQTKKKPAAHLTFLTMLLAAFWLAACTQIPGLGVLPSLPPTIIVPSLVSTTPSPMLAKATLTLDPPPQKPAMTATLQSTADAGATQVAAEDLAQAQTAMAELQQANASPTTCTNNRCPTVTLTPWVWHTRTPTISPTPTLPRAYLIFLRPGPLSKLVSPILLEAAAHTGANGDIRVELVGEDGQVIMRKILQVSTEAELQFFLSTNVEFEISTVAEAARLQISVDDVFHRPVALASVDIILLSIGENDRNPVSDGIEPFIIRQPKPDQVISGGKVTLEGMARPFNQQPLQMELITEQGAVVGVKQVFLTPNPDGKYVPFRVEIPYSVTQARGVRLVIHQDGEHIPGIIALNSLTLYLMP